jgi:hypothetical protein
MRGVAAWEDSAVTDNRNNDLRASFKGTPLPFIWFCGERLPPWAVTIDVLASRDILGEVAWDTRIGDDEVCIFWWRFTICAERTRQAAAQIMLEHTNFLQQMAPTVRERALGLLGERIPDAAPGLIFRQWEAALNSIAHLCAGQTQVEWYGDSPDAR